MSDISWPGGQLPPFAMSVPEVAFDAQVGTLGQRFGWQKAHSCPCSAAKSTGSPDPNCLSCGGRGVYWDAPIDFVGLFTYMHTASAPDEPGASTNVMTGMEQRAEPTLTIPKNGSQNENTVWQQASAFDAYVEYDAPTRYNFVAMNDTGTIVLPYQMQVQIVSLTAYDPATSQIVPVPEDSYSYDPRVGVLVPQMDRGVAVTVEFYALPIYVAYRKAGSLPHTRPFGQNTSGLPVRFHLTMLDTWLRARSQGDGPNAVRGG